MRFRVLGPLRVLIEGDERPLGGPKQRLVLALLISAEGRAVSVGSLIEGLWGDDVPASAKKMLQGYVHHLRSQVGDVLRTEGAGYSLAVDGRVDAVEFAGLHDEATGLLATNPHRAAGLLREALALWDGPAYADLQHELALAPEITRLDNLRLAVLGDRIEADLACGGGSALVGELEALTVEYPLHERFRAQHMMALYRSGRQVEALRAYERLRRFLADEIGVEPGGDLKELEQRILARDEGLLLGGVEEQTGIRTVRGYELRELVSSGPGGEVYRAYQRSVGRQVAVRVLGPEIADCPDFIADHLTATQRVAALDHPHVCLIFDAWREPGCAYQVSRWLSGGSLRERLAQGELSTATSLRVLEQVGGALTSAHANGVVHGRLDASSVLFDDTENAYLSGFVAGLDRPDASAAGDRADFAALAHHLLAGSPPCRGPTGYGLGAAESLPQGCEAVLQMAFSPEGYERVDDFLRSLQRAMGLDAVAPASSEPPPRTDRRNPYKSLRAFQEGDAADFYGREDLLDALVRKLGGHRLVAVVGPSGCGKSSLVKAGLLPRLRDAPGPTRLVTEMYPGPFPFEELEDALLRVGVNRSSVIEDLTADARGLGRVLEQVLPTGASDLVLVIDQFEELFSMVDAKEVRQLFLDSLADAVADPCSRLRVVLSMRADFFDRPLQYPRFGELLQAGLVPLTAPDTDQLARAVVEPARSVGVEFEPGLVPQIVDDVAGQAGALPLLQYALTELFDQREADRLTLAAYRRSGGVVGALGRRAEELYLGLTPAGRHAARQAFLRMVAVDEATDDVRRRVRRSELASLDVSEAALAEALQAFGSHRLLTFDLDPTTRGPTVEVAHEAMLREWPRLADWVEQLRDDLVLRRRLETAMGEWQEAGEDPAYLLTGGRLTQFDTWADTTELSLGTRERSFLEMGRQRDEALARRTAVRRRRVMVALAGVTLVAVAFGMLALVQRGQATDEAYLAETARLGSQAGVVVDSNRELALLMAAEAYRRDPGFAGLGALQRVLVDTGPFLGVIGESDPYREVQWVTGDSILAVSGDELHSLDAAGTTAAVLPIESPAILASSPAGLAAVADRRGDVWLVDVERGVVDSFVPGRGSSAAALSPDGTILALGYPDGSIRAYDTESGQETASAEAGDTSPDRTGIDLLAFDAGGDRLVSVRGTRIRAWRATDLSPLGPEFQHVSGPDEFNLSPRSPRHVWFGGADPTIVTVDETHVVRWRATTGERISLGTAPTGLTDAGRDAIGIADAVPGATGEILVLTSDGRVLGLEIDELTRGRSTTANVPAFTFDAQRVDTPALGVAPDRTSIAVASNQGIVVAALDGRRLLADAHPIGTSVLPTLNRAGTALAAGLASDGILDLTADPPTPRPFDVGVEIAAFAGSPPTYQFTTAGPQDLLLWTSGPELVALANAYDYESGEYIGEFRGAFVPAWSDDGTLVAAARSTGGSTVAEVATGAILFEHPGLARTADFDSTGRRVVLSLVETSDPGPVIPGLGLVVDLDDGTVTSLPEMPGGTFSAAFTPSDDEIVLVGGAGAIWAVDPERPDTWREFQDADESTELLAAPPRFSTDGEWMFSSADGSARLWHVASGRQLGQPFPSQPGGVPYAVADDDVLRMVTALEGNALVWDLDLTGWAEVACAAVGRDMTETEWDLFGPTDTEHRATCPSP